MTALDSLRRFLRDHPLLADALLALALYLFVLFVREPHAPSRDPVPQSMVVLVGLTCAALVARRRWPIPVLLLTTAGSLVATLIVGGRTTVAVAACVAVYTVAVRTGRRTAVLTWILTALALTATGLISTQASAVNLDTFSYIAWTGLAAATGYAVQHRRAYLAAIEERALRAVESHEEETRRRVAEERLHIARELHDVVAHHIAVVNVQAGVASHLLSTQPEAAQEALGNVRQASRAILDGMGGILNVLRQSEEAPPTEPVPCMDQFDELVASFAAAGLEVTWSIAGSPVAAGSTVDLVTYRVLEEALTNAHKHGTGTAHVAVDYTSSSISLLVTNSMRQSVPVNSSGPTAPASTSRVGDNGYGLVGMRERAAAVGGVLHAVPGPEGRFRVEATLPLEAAPTT